MGTSLEIHEHRFDSIATLASTFRAGNSLKEEDISLLNEIEHLYSGKTRFNEVQPADIARAAAIMPLINKNGALMSYLEERRAAQSTRNQVTTLMKDPVDGKAQEIAKTRSELARIRKQQADRRMEIDKGLENGWITEYRLAEIANDLYRHDTDIPMFYPIKSGQTEFKRIIDLDDKISWCESNKQIKTVAAKLKRFQETKSIITQHLEIIPWAEYYHYTNYTLENQANELEKALARLAK